ncbi:MAG: exopolysaccharide biosynthesis polyprenyl glycosylphosphotransferase [Thermoleophilaceae bacterium]|nr:exopolysaccharide biosynthesis polyprenyl glycosylphosphotransferase [Thermoleophilaceae bacterium]
MADDANSTSQREYSIDLDMSSLTGGFESETLFNDYPAAGEMKPRVPAPTRLDEAYRHEFELLDTRESLKDGRPARVSDTLLRRSLALSDIFGVAAAFLLTTALSPNISFDITTVAILVLVVPVMKLIELYDRDATLIHKTTLDDVPRIIAASMAFTLVAFSARDLVNDGPIYNDAVSMLLLCASMTVFVTLFRRTTRTVVRSMTPEERLLVIGGSEETEQLQYRLERTATINAVVIARVPIAFAELSYGPSRLLSRPRDLEREIRAHQIDRVVIMPGQRHSNEVADLIRTIRSIGVKLNVLPNAGDAIGNVTLTDDVAGIQMVAIRDTEMSASSRALKRTMDIVGAFFGLLLLAPLLIGVAIAIKLDSRGTVLYRQKRIGRDGKTFEMLKFRSMVTGADAQKSELQHLSEGEGMFKIEDDPRVTRVGAFIRATSIDELPQLVNILRGQMSLVGPRPLVPEEDAAITGWYRRRSQITPGATGVWQLLGKVRIPIDEMAKLDYMYVANWSLWSDIKILTRTVTHVVLRRGL